MTEPRSKVMDLADAAALVQDRCRLAIGGFAVYQKPMAFLRELVRQGRRNLTIVGVANGPDLDLLVAGGCVTRVETSYVGLEKHGLALNFRRAAEAGAISVVDYPELASWDRFRASEEGFAFWPCSFLGGTDILRTNPDIRPFDCPVTGRPLHALPAASPDVVVIHAIAADAQGNVVLPARRLLPQHHDLSLARACDTVIVTVEKIVEKDYIRRHADHVQIPSYRTKAVVELPWGAHPTPLLGRYLMDDAHMAEYVAASAGAGPMAAYLEAYVTGVSHADYLARLGPTRLASLQDLDMPT